MASKKYKFAEMSKTKLHLFLALTSGVALGLAWPTHGFTLLIFTALLPLFFLENSIRSDAFQYKGLRVFAYSYLSFLSWNLITTWWLYNATFFGMAFANLCNSLFYAFLFWLFYWAKGRLPIRAAHLFLIALWLAFEKLHLTWDFSWTWLNLGNVFSEKIYWIQWYEYTGTFGGSLWVLGINIGLYSKLKDYNLRQGIPLLLKKIALPLVAIALPVAFSLFLYQKVVDVEPTIKVLMHQPNVDPYDTKYELTNTEFLAAFSDQLKPHLHAGIDYVLSPETYFAEGYGEQLQGFEQSILYQKMQRELVKYPNIQWITGMQYYNLYRQTEAPSLTANKVRDGLWVEYYNSALGVQSRAKAQLYHKSKLVVGIENMPFKALLKPLLGELLIDLGGTVAGRVTQKNRTVFTHSKSKVKTGPIICWESVFGAFVTDYVKEGADFLAVISNDAWWGNTPGHRQLLSYTRLRAIETRRDIARAANTGISAVIDARGELRTESQYNTKTVLEGAVAPRSEVTFYVRYGDIIGRWAIFVSGIYFLLALSGRLKKDKNTPISKPY
jgi:apolipoprotein N-acyltransferase